MKKNLFYVTFIILVCTTFLFSSDNAIIIKDKKVQITNDKGKTWASITFEHYKSNSKSESKSDSNNKKPTLLITSESQYSTDGGKSWNKLENVERYSSNYDEIRIYPNPANEKIYIRNAENPNVKIYRLDGTLVLENTFSDIIDISQIPSGTYFVKIGSDKLNIKVLVKI